MKTKNLFDPLPEPGPDDGEDFMDLLVRTGCRLERIVSHGQSSAEGFWYAQEEDEWVLVVEGGATLEFEDPAAVAELQRGDHLLIPAGRRHRVARTASPTVWLALWVPPQAGSES